MDSRRRFIRTFARGLATTTLAPSTVLAANDRIRLGVIGAGDRGMQIAREALECSNTEIVAFADIYTRRLEDSRQIVPVARTFQDYRYLLDIKEIDAVLIATPQHLHCEHFVAALEAGKHVYQERTMAFTVPHAKQMRAAFQRCGKRVVQIGHQSCSSGLMKDALAFLGSGKMGKVTAIVAHMYRNTPHGKPQWARPVYPDMTSGTILWKAFLGESPERPFDANRFANWRLFWDYSGGAIHENMAQQLAFWYRALNLQIPRAVNMAGGVYLWKDGREVPDTMTVTMEHPEEILFTWTSGFGNNHLGVTEEVLGAEGTISKGHRIRWSPQKVNRPGDAEIVGQTPTPKNAHMQDFLDCIRTGREPNCPFEVGYRTSIACRMAVESLRQGRTMRWDPVREEIV